MSTDLTMVAAVLASNLRFCPLDLGQCDEIECPLRLVLPKSKRCEAETFMQVWMFHGRFASRSLRKSWRRSIYDATADDHKTKGIFIEHGIITGLSVLLDSELDRYFPFDSTGTVATTKAVPDQTFESISYPGDLISISRALVSQFEICHA